MTPTCKPCLISEYPLKSAWLEAFSLPALSTAFDDFRTAERGRPVAFKMDVVHYNNVMTATTPGTLLVSQGPHQEFEQVTARDALPQPHLQKAMEILIYTPSLIRNIIGVPWPEIGWQETSARWGHNFRELWIFPRAALVMDNQHTCHAKDVEDLSYHSLVMHEQPKSNHDALALADYINELLRRTSSFAIPDIVERWPEDVPRGSIPFTPVEPSRLKDD